MAHLLGDASASGRAPCFRSRFLFNFNKNVAQMDVLHPETPVATRKTWKLRPGCLFPPHGQGSYHPHPDQTPAHEPHADRPTGPRRRPGLSVGTGEHRSGRHRSRRPVAVQPIDREHMFD